MKIAVIGCGYLGAVHSAAMSSVGHEVVGVDVDPRKLEMLSSGHAPFYEPGFDELLTEQVATGRLSFTDDFSKVADAEVIFIGVGTPQTEGSNAADLRYVNSAIESLKPYIGAHTLIAGKSTVPVGTAARLASEIESTGARMLWNPEFLREGFAVQDTLRPDRLVYGIGDGDTTSVAQLDEVYRSILDTGVDRIVTDLATAELVKVSANAFLATKISFINAMAEIAEQVGADVTELADAIGLDERIGRKFLNSGLGFGGGCLPKDIRAFQARAEEVGATESLQFLSEVDKVNLRRRDHVVDLAARELDALGSKRVAVLGLAFKPNSDDVRDSAALDVAARLTADGYEVRGYDPKAGETAGRVQPDLDIRSTLAEAVAEADVIVVGTEWAEFKELDPATLESPAKVVIDGRNTLDRKRWHDAGFKVIALGRRTLEPKA
ncbi:UDP-glucose dehydrogenase family protein [Agrococcus casei]|uniref:UDP-glucose dehydrogenase family protein n=1 Tax=Agrococcus casei TaxID=343512 RepID=UPI003F91D923